MALRRATRDALAFLDAIRDVPVEERFSCFVNDSLGWTVISMKNDREVPFA